MLPMVGARSERFEQFRGAILALIGPRGIEQGQLDVLDRAGSRKQIEVLKDEADLAAADQRQIIFRQRCDIYIL